MSFAGTKRGKHRHATKARKNWGCNEFPVPIILTEIRQTLSRKLEQRRGMHRRRNLAWLYLKLWRFL